VRGHGLGVLERAAGFEIGGDTSRPEHVAAEFDLEAGIGRASAHHAIGVDPVHWPIGEDAGLSDRGAEERGLAILPDPGRGQVLVDKGFELTTG